MPAAAVIPAPIAYVKIAAVKKLVVGFLVWCAEPASYGGECLLRACHTSGAAILSEPLGERGEFADPDRLL